MFVFAFPDQNLKHMDILENTIVQLLKRTQCRNYMIIPSSMGKADEELSGVERNHHKCISLSASVKQTDGVCQDTSVSPLLTWNNQDELNTQEFKAPLFSA